MRILLVLCLAAVAGAIAAGAALLIAALTGSTFSPLGGAVIGMVLGLSAGGVGRRGPGSLSAVEALACAVAAAASAWSIVRAVQG